MSGLRRDLADWRRREPLWCPFIVACVPTYLAFALIAWLRGYESPLAYVGLALMTAAYALVKCEVSAVKRKTTGTACITRTTWLFDAETGEWQTWSTPETPSQTLSRGGSL